MQCRQQLDGEAEDVDDARDGLVLPAHGAAAVRGLVPVAGGGHPQPRPALL